MTRPSTCWELGKDYEHYRIGKWKYRTLLPYSILLPPDLWPANEVSTQFFALTTVGLLSVGPGYAWNGPSGITIDTPDFIRGSAVHDCGYQMMRERCLDYRTQRGPADRLLWQQCRADGMAFWRIAYLRPFLYVFGGASATPPE